MTPANGPGDRLRQESLPEYCWQRSSRWHSTRQPREPLLRGSGRSSFRILRLVFVCGIARFSESSARGEVGRGALITGILPEVRGRSRGRSGGRSCGRTGGGRLATGTAEVVAELLATSSSLRLASAEPLPRIPTLVQISTSSLLSTFSSFANAYMRTAKIYSPCDVSASSQTSQRPVWLKTVAKQLSY